MIRNEKFAEILLKISNFFQIIRLNYFAHCIKHEIGNFYRKIGNIEKANKIQLAVCRYTEKFRQSELRIKALLSLGSTNRDLGNSELAINNYQEAVELAKKTNSFNLIGESYRCLSFVYLKRGEIIETAQWINKLIRIIPKMTNKRMLANCYAILGNYHHHIGNIEKSIENLQIALNYAEKSKFPERESTILGDLGTLYSKPVLNDLEQANSYLQKARNIAKQTNYLKSYYSVTWRLAELEKSRGNLEIALKYYKEMYSVSKKRTLKRLEGDSLVGIGDVYAEIHQAEKAIEYFTQAKEIFTKINYPRDYSHVLYREANLLFELGNYNEAILNYKKVITQLLELSYYETIWMVYRKIGKCEEKLGNKLNAYNYYKEAIESIEDIRSLLKNEKSKISYFGDRTDAYKDMVDLLSKLSISEQKKLGIKTDQEVYKYIERSKSRVLLDQLGNIQIRIPDIESDELQKKRVILENKLHIIEEKLENIEFSINHKTSNSNQKNLSIMYKQTFIEWQNIIEEIKKNHPQYMSLNQIDVIELNDLSEKLIKNDNEALLHYFITNEAVYVLVVKSNETKFIKLTEKISELKSITNSFLNNITDIKGKDTAEIIKSVDEINKIGKNLFNILINPIYELLQKTQFITFIPHNFLHGFPFHVIQNPLENEPLGFTFEINYVQSATILNYCHEKSFDNVYDSFLGLAISDAKQINLPKLHYVEEEITKISDFFDTTKSIVFTGKNANKENFILNSPKKDILHLACHAEFNNIIPELSKLYLYPSDRDNGELTAAEIFNLQLKKNCVVVLSACNTGVSSITKSDELIGLTRAFMFAGASSIVATLWVVDDSSTRLFMVEFYRSLLSGMRKSKAIISAQKYLMSTDPIYSHPYFWGGIILIGANN